MRIVSLVSSATEILFGIGLGDCVVAISHECDYPKEASDRIRVTRSNVDSNRSSEAIDEQVRLLAKSGTPLYELDAEQIAALRPDFIVTQSQCDVCAVRYDDVLRLVATNQRLKETCVLALNPTSLAGVFADILRIGQATGVVHVAERYVELLRKRVGQIVDRTSALSLEARPRTVCVEWIDPLMLAANWTPEMIEMAGGANGLSQGGLHSTYSNWSQVMDFNPEVIVVAPCGFDLPRSLREAQGLFAIEGWHSLSAVKSGRVHVVDGNAYLNRSGPRLVDSLEILACLLHPSLFDDLRPWLPENATALLRPVSY